jgi:predicted nucleotidyltransferase
MNNSTKKTGSLGISCMENEIPCMDKIISIIVSLASPGRIMLFGSYARGDHAEKSDIDLLIIKKV